MSYSITKNGKCAKHLCVIDENAKSVSTTEGGLVFDFSHDSHDYDWSFKTGNGCTFNTGSDCTFKTGSLCTFNTGSDCTFVTGGDCTFDTGSDCTFVTGSHCAFKTGYNCVVVDRSRDVVLSFIAPAKVDFKTDDSEQGYTLVIQKKKITIELTDEQIENLKKQGIIT